MKSEVSWDALNLVDATGKTGPAFLEFCERKLIDYEDAAARGELGMAKKAAVLRQLLDDPVGCRFMAAGDCYLESLCNELRAAFVAEIAG